MANHAALAKIHIAQKQLGIGDDNYRAILLSITGQESSSLLNQRQVDDVLAEFRRLGWEPTRTFRRSSKPFVRLIYALWKEAAQLGAVSNGSKAALRSFVERQTRRGSEQGVSDPEFLEARDANCISEGLKAIIARAKAVELHRQGSPIATKD